MEYQIVFKNLGVDEDKFHFVEILVENNDCKVLVAQYTYIEELRHFGEQLIDFPKTVTDTICYESGQNKDEWASYFCLKAFCYDANGHVAMNVFARVNGNIVTKHRSEFSLVCEAASINRLGLKLQSWNPLLNEKLIWTSDEYDI